MEPRIEHYKDHYRVVWSDGSTTEVDTYEEAEEEIKESEEAQASSERRIDMKNDIKTAGNIIYGRQGWAYICNSLKFAVLKADLIRRSLCDSDLLFGDLFIKIAEGVILNLSTRKELIPNEPQRVATKTKT